MGMPPATILNVIAAAGSDVVSVSTRSWDLNRSKPILLPDTFYASHETFKLGQLSANFTLLKISKLGLHSAISQVINIQHRLLSLILQRLSCAPASSVNGRVFITVRWASL